MDKRFWAVIGVILAIFIGIVIVNNNKADTANGGSKSTAAATDHVKGGNAKNVTVVEYGDFQCPVCALYEPTVQQVVQKYDADIKFQYRHFPLQQIHQNAFAGARAAEAAGLQGKFWEMHDQLYANQNTWSASTDPLSLYSQYAGSIEGLNVDQFKKDFAAKKVNDAINADMREGTKLNITGTPTFFIDGKKIELKDIVDDSNNQPSLDKFSKLIDAAIAKKSGGN